MLSNVAAHSLADVSLFQATPEQVIESRKRSWVEWGRRASQAHYLQRNAWQDELPPSTGGKMITWVLAPGDDPRTLDFFCGCETYRRTAVLARPVVGASESTVSATAYAIASVFTPPRHRRRGYARHMMRLLHWVLAPRSLVLSGHSFPTAWGVAPAPLAQEEPAFAVLYSDVGPAFYAACGPGEQHGGGWEVQGAVATTWNVTAGAATEEVVDGASGGADGSEDGVRWEWLDATQLDAVWETDAALMKRDLARTAAASVPPHADSGSATAGGPLQVFANFLPTAGVASFLVQRTMCIDDADPGRAPRLSWPTDVWGVRLIAARLSARDDDDDDESLTYATWTLDVRTPPRTLAVTRLRASTRTVAPLLVQVLAAARNAGVEHVEVWNLPAECADAARAMGGTTAARDEHLPALKWYAERADVVWAFNERFCWC